MNLNNFSKFLKIKPNNMMIQRMTKLKKQRNTQNKPHKSKKKLTLYLMLFKNNSKKQRNTKTKSNKNKNKMILYHK